MGVGAQVLDDPLSNLPTLPDVLDAGVVGSGGSIGEGALVGADK